MQPIPVTVAGETFLIPTLRVQQVIDVSTLRHDRERRDLIADLEAAGIEPQERLRLLQDQRKERGLSSVIVRSAFTVDGAWAIVHAALDGEIPEVLRSIDPTTLTKTALGCLGMDLDDLVGDSDEDGSAEGKEEAGGIGSASRPSFSDDYLESETR